MYDNVGCHRSGFTVKFMRMHPGVKIPIPPYTP